MADDNSPQSNPASKGLPDGYGPTFATAVPRCPITYRRLPASNVDKFIESPGVAHANFAPSVDEPNGSVEFSGIYSDYVSSCRRSAPLGDSTGDAATDIGYLLTLRSDGAAATCALLEPQQ